MNDLKKVQKISKSKINTKNLKSFAGYIRENLLKEYVQESVSIVKDLDLPIMNFFNHLSDQEIFNMSMISSEKFLCSIEDGTALDVAKENMKLWEEDKLPGIPKNAIQPSDLVFGYVAQRKSFLKFLPAYAPSSEDALPIIIELEDYLMQVQDLGIKGLFKIQKETENYYKESESKFSLLVESIKDYAVIMLDVDGNIMTWNKGAEHIKGYSDEEIIGKNFRLFYTKEEIQLGEPEYNLKTAKENGRYNCEGWRVRKDGSEFWADIVITALFDDDGNLKGYVKVTRDNTERKKVRMAELKQSEERFSKAFQMSPAGVIISNIQTQKVIDVNDSYLQMVGYRREEVFNRPASDINPFIDKSIREKYIADLNLKGSIKNAEFQFRKKSGELGYALFSSELVLINKEKCILTIIYDITARKLSEEQLKESEEQIQTIFDNAPEAIFVIDSESKIIKWNPKAVNLFGWKTEEVLGKSLYNYIFSPEAKETHIKEMKNFLSTGESSFFNKAIESKAINKEGQSFDIALSIAPSISKRKFVFIGFIRDITQSKKAAVELENKTQELSRSNSELEQFAYVASHDLQEPLRMVTSYVQLLAKRYQDKLDNDANDFIGYAVDGSNRMRNLINSLLEYSRINRVKSFETIDVNKLLVEVEQNLKDQIEESNAIIKIADLPKINGDSVLIAQLFQNLISNALKFKSEKINPLIEISAETKNNEIQFAVKDNGIGIQKEYSDKIFVIFQRLHSKNKYPGTGIGLAICKKIVERHGGGIWVESEIDKGSTFYFTIKT